jgi:signal transduction histidine kinase/CheY-like chemotaxis protein
MKAKTEVLHVLVVDDDDLGRTTLTQALSEAGYDVRGVPSGQQAIEHARQVEGNLDFIIMDQVLLLGEMDGIEATRQIQHQYPRIRTIVMTLYGDGESSRAALTAGAYRYVFRSPVLAEAAAEIVSLIGSAQSLSQIEADLHDSFWLQNVTPRMNMAVGIVDRTYRVLYANPAQNALAGRKTRLGGICWVEWHNAVQQKGPCPWCPVKPVFDGEQHPSTVVPLFRRDEVRHWLTNASPITDREGNIIAALKWGEDVTEREMIHMQALEAQDSDGRLKAALNQIRQLGYSRARLFELSENPPQLIARVQFGGADWHPPKPKFLASLDRAFKATLFTVRAPDIYHRRGEDDVEMNMLTGRGTVHEWLDIPLWGDSEIIGVIEIDNQPVGPFPHGREPQPRPLSNEHFDQLLSIAGYAARAIGEERLFKEVSLKLQFQESLRQTETELAQILDENLLLKWMIPQAVNFLHASGGSLSLCDPENDQVRIVYTEHLDRLESATFKYGEGLNGRVAATGQSLILNDYYRTPEHSPLLDTPSYQRLFQSALAAPLVMDGVVQWVLAIVDQDPTRAFQKYELELLEYFTRRVVVAIQNAAYFKEIKQWAAELEALANKLRAINLIATYIQGEDDIEIVLRLALTGVTSGDGLRFSRAMLFLLDESNHWLEGRLAIGPMTRDEANETWNRVKEDSLTTLLDEVRRWPPGAHDPLDQEIRNIRLRLDCQGMLCECFREGKSCTTAEAQFLRTSNPRLAAILSDHPIAFIPLNAKSRTLGVMVVDNLFLPDPTIKDESLHLAEMLADQLALRFDNQMLLKQLEDRFGEIAHELRSPLFPLKTQIQRLSEGQIKASREVYEQVLASVVTLESLVTEMLNLKKIESGQLKLNKTQVSLRAIIKRVTSLYRYSAHTKRIKLTTHSRHKQELLVVDEERLFNALAAVVDNALKFTPEGGSVAVRTADTKAEWRIQVIDTGYGIPLAEHPRIFEKYFRGALALQKGVDGNGIGLLVAKLIVNAHGGDITFTSQPGKGSTFTISIPK